jgi:putative FmdB family regulatory protein
VPTYQYVCTDCGSDLEAVQSFSEPSLSECPTCGGKLRKRFSAVGVVFKGSGFYRNDSRSEARGAAERKSDSGDKADKADTKTEKVDASAKSDSSAAAKTSTDTPASKPKSDSGSGSSSSNGSGTSSSSTSGSGSKTSTAA